MGIAVLGLMGEIVFTLFIFWPIAYGSSTRFMGNGVDILIALATACLGTVFGVRGFCRTKGKWRWLAGLSILISYSPFLVEMILEIWIVNFHHLHLGS